MIDVSTQTDLDAAPTDISSGSSVSEAMTGTKTPMIDVPTQTNLDTTPMDISSGSSVSETMTGTKTPSTHTFLRLTAPILRSPHPFLPLTAPIPTSMAQEVSVSTESRAHEETRQELADIKAQLATKDEEIEQYKRRLTEMTKSREEQTQQYNESQARLGDANINIGKLKDSMEEQAASSQVEVNDLRTALEEAESRVSELVVERNSSQNSLFETQLPDVSTEAELVSELDVAIVGRPADDSAMHQGETGHGTEESADDIALKQPVDETYGPADNDSDDSSVKGPASEDTEVEEPRGKMRKTSKTASIFAAAADIDLSPSSPKGKQKEERTPALGQEGSRLFSFAPSEDGERAEQTPRYQVPDGTSLSFNLSSANPFKSFAAPSPGDRREDEQKQEPTDKATNDPLLAAEGASEGQVDSSQSSSNAGTAIAGEDDDPHHLYDIEPGYIPPAQRRMVPASTSATNEEEDANDNSTGVPRITITPASTFEHEVEVGSSNILERNGFDVAALSRILGLGCPAAHETPEAVSHQSGNVERRNLEGGNHGAENLLERLLPREGHYPSYEEATGIQSVVWHGRGRTAEEILLECERDSEAKDGMEEDIALVISGIESLNLGPSLPSDGSRAPVGNARGDEVDRSAEREVPKDDEPQTKVVKEDAESQLDAPLFCQPNESSSATIVDSTVQPQQLPSIAPLSASSSSSSSYPSSSVSPVTTPPAAHEPERRSKNGNPMDQNGRLYLWHVWPLMRKKKPRAIGGAQ